MNKAHIIKALSQEILKGWLHFPCIKIDVMYDPIHFTCLFTLHLATCSYLLDPIIHFPLLSWLVLFLPGREYNKDSRISWETRKYKSNKKNALAYSQSPLTHKGKKTEDRKEFLITVELFWFENSGLFKKTYSKWKQIGLHS